MVRLWYRNGGMGLKISGDYTLDWPDVARRVKDVAGWRCDRCGHPHDPAVGYSLTVHHFDGNKGNNAPWNLMPLCQRCHLSVQARVDPEIGLLVDPSVWAMPYIAGFYAAGRGVPSPLYDLRRWIAECEANGRQWPPWAPTTWDDVTTGGAV